MTAKTAKVKKKPKKPEKQGAEPSRPDPALLLRWYDKHRRDLPWRAAPGEVADPYRVWLSEIMLQQTTVAAVGPYFRKFVARWPDIEALAAAPLDDVLAAWAGLGYYRRARFLHRCAQELVATRGGAFPPDEAALRALPGLGPYTAAAVAAIAFDRPANVVDGNVERVMARIFAVSEPMPAAKKRLRALAATLVPAARCGDYAQALMDLGATVCVPQTPKCSLCPWHEFCQARALDIAGDLPKRAPKAARPLRRALAFVAVNESGAIWLRKRGDEGLLAGMSEVPSSPWLEQPLPGLAEAASSAPFKASWRVLPGFVTHVFTHFAFEVAVAVAQVPAARGKGAEGKWVPRRALDREALPSVMKKIIAYAVKSL